jgi:hypothetical protein
MTGHLRLVKPAGPKPPKRGRERPYQSDLFSPEEAARLLAALKNARAMFGTWACLADAMRVPLTTIGAVKARRQRFSGALAIRLARALGKPLESLYRAPTDASTCPACGARRTP